MKGDMRQLIETMWKNGATRAEAQAASLELSRGLDISRQARNKLLLLFYGTAHDPKPVRRTALAAVDPEWRVYGGSRPYGIRFRDLPEPMNISAAAPASAPAVPALVLSVDVSATSDMQDDPPSMMKSCLKNGPRALPAPPRPPAACAAPLTPIEHSRPRKRVRIVAEPSVVRIEAKTALAPCKADLFFSSAEMAHSQQLALQGLLCRRD